MRMNKWMVVALSGMMVAGAMAAEPAAVETAGFQASLTPDVAIKSRDTQINGMTLSIWGENPQKSFALGFVNGATGDSQGFALGVLWNYAENYKGVQWASLVNYNTGDMTGWQSACVNVNKGTFTGLQSGAVNYAGTLTGLQLGFVNYATSAVNGLQIGAINIIEENEWFSDFPDDFAKGMVVVNWSFE